MRALGARSLSSILWLVLEASWWLAAIALCLLTGLLVISLWVPLSGDNLTMDLPVAMELDAPFRGTSMAMEASAQIEKLHGNLRFPVRTGAFFWASLLFIVALCGLLLSIITHLRHIFWTLSRGQLFLSENSRRIRWVGLLVISGEVGRAALVYFWSYYSSLHCTVDGLHFVASADFNAVTILGGFAILVIAEVFQEATRLYEDHSLTI